MKRNRKVLQVVAVIILGLLLSACGQDQYEPQAINEETDVCAVCQMSVVDNQFATQLTQTDGRSLKFDDIGCMYDWMSENEEIGMAFVRDYHSLEWIEFDEAFFAYDASFETPMSYGVLSFENETAAQAFIDESGTGTLMSPSQLSDHSWESGMNHGHHDGHEHNGHGAENNQADGEETGGHSH